MDYPQYLTKCIGQELRFVFSHTMEINLEERSASCAGSMSKDNYVDYDRTEIKLVFGNRMKEGFYISSRLEKSKAGMPFLELKFNPLGDFDDKFSKSKLRTSEVLHTIKLVSKDSCPALYLGFASGNSFLCSAVELDQSETSIVISFISKSEEEVLKGYEVLESYDMHEA